MARMGEKKGPEIEGCPFPISSSGSKSSAARQAYLGSRNISLLSVVSLSSESREQAMRLQEKLPQRPLSISLYLRASGRGAERLTKFCRSLVAFNGILRHFRGCLEMLISQASQG